MIDCLLCRKSVATNLIHSKLKIMRKLKLLFITLAISSLGLTTQVAGSSLGDTLLAWNAGDLTQTPMLRGIVFAENHYWLSGLDPNQGNARKLYKISADAQEIVESWSYSNLSQQDFWKGLAYDGQFLYGTSTDTIYQINMQTGQRTGFQIPAPMYYPSGIAYDPISDHFWVSGDGNLIYEINRDGEVINSIAFVPDLPTAGIAWDTWTVGGPYLWVWSMKYTSTDVRPKAYQINVATGQPTGVTFEGVNMFEGKIDGAVSLSFSDQIIEDKVVFVALQESHYQWPTDQLDWVVLYDLDPLGSGVPGPIVNVDPAFVQNNLIFNDSIDVTLNLFNLSDEWDLNWFVTLEYPGMENDMPGEVLFDFDLTSLTAPVSGKAIRSIAYLNDHFYFTTYPGLPFDPELIYKVSSDGSTIVRVDTMGWSSWNGSALASDGEYLYASSKYVIVKVDPETMEVVDFTLNTNFSVGSMAYDGQTERFFLANGNYIRTISKTGQVLNFYQTQYNIKGLAWDKWSPGGPYLWAYTQSADGIKAVRLNPATGFHTGVEFDGISLGDDPDMPDQARDIFVTSSWQQNSLTMLALNKSFDGGQPEDQTDHVIVYDLDATPAPGWISLLGQAAGVTAPLGSDEFTIRLTAIMEDTLMTANIIINNNSVVNPRLTVPVAFLMEADGTAVGMIESPFASKNLVQSIYPNPAVNQVQLLLNQNGNNFRVDLYNSLGMLVQSRMDSGQERLVIDVSSLTQGIYILIVSDGETTEQHKLVVR